MEPPSLIKAFLENREECVCLPSAFDPSQRKQSLTRVSIKILQLTLQLLSVPANLAATLSASSAPEIKVFWAAELT